MTGHPDKEVGALKKSALALCVAAALCLSGCGELLERSYSASTPHADKPTVAEDPSILRVEDYRQLISAVLYFVTQGEEQGVIQLHNYAGPVEADLAAACAEVATQDPLGAYCVERIEHTCTRVVSYYQATLSIRYRRTREQVDAIVSVTGAGAIRDSLEQAMADFAPEVVLRVGYYSESEPSIAQLLRRAYLDAPGTALGQPQAQVEIYPDSGLERVVEIALTYPHSSTVLRRRAREVEQTLDDLDLPRVSPGSAADTALACVQAVTANATYDPQADATVYAAVVEGRTNDEGMALACALLCRRQGLDCDVVEGTTPDGPRLWCHVAPRDDETLYIDPCADAPQPCTAQQLYDAGYRWSDQPGQPGE